ncbi:MAG TPA: phosphatidylserine decarboxylase, partial [Gammaproteobacteria bacterium]|nr:phosphatidylserine decarboxylase [Gammaproteobacteria bacterium]
NQQSANAIPNLFARNERVILFFDTEFGPMALVLVGAMIVASISTVFAGLVAPNKIMLERLYSHTLEEKMSFKKGEEIAYFHLGSTVVALLGNKNIQWASSVTNAHSLLLGQLLAHV